LRIAETKSVLQKIPRDRRNVACRNSSGSNVRLINENQSRSHGESRLQNTILGAGICSRRPAGAVRCPATGLKQRFPHESGYSDAL